MKNINWKGKIYKINITVKSKKISVKETSTLFQRFFLFVLKNKNIHEATRTKILTELNKNISEARAQYDKIDSEARAQYDKIRSEAWAQYQKEINIKIREIIVKYELDYKE